MARGKLLSTEERAQIDILVKVQKILNDISTLIQQTQDRVKHNLLTSSI